MTDTINLEKWVIFINKKQMLKIIMYNFKHLYYYLIISYSCKKLIIS